MFRKLLKFWRRLRKLEANVVYHWCGDVFLIKCPEWTRDRILKCFPELHDFKCKVKFVGEDREINPYEQPSSTYGLTKPVFYGIYDAEKEDIHIYKKEYPIY